MAKFTERIIESFGGITQRGLDTAVSRAYEAGYYDGNDDPASGTTAAGGQGYRRAMSSGLRDFSKVSPEEVLETVWTLWQSSPVANRSLNIKRDYIVGTGARPQAANDDLQAILDAFWELNKMAVQHKKFTKQLFGFGEQCFPAFVRDSDGRTRLGYIDPQEIDIDGGVITDPNNSLDACAVVVKQPINLKEWETKIDGKRVYRIIRREEDPNNKHAGKYVKAEQATLSTWEKTMLKAYGLTKYSGDCFYTGVNNPSNMPRGFSDLLQVADWIDQADATLFALADREQFASYFSFDVTLTSSDDQKVSQRAKEIRMRPPKKGTVNVHNDSEKWEMFTADLKQQGSIATFRALLGWILGGMGLPVHWYGFGDDANRATAAAQGTPTENSLEHDQGVVKDMLVWILEFVRDQAIISGKWIPNKDTDTNVTVIMPDVSPKDNSLIIQSMSPLAMALVAAVDAKWIAKETAVKAWAKIMAEFGVEIDPASELEKVAAQDEEEDTAVAQADNEKLANAMERNGVIASA